MGSSTKKGKFSRFLQFVAVLVGIWFVILVFVNFRTFSFNENWKNQPDYHKKILSDPYWSDQIGEDVAEAPQYEKQYPRRPKKK